MKSTIICALYIVFSLAMAGCDLPEAAANEAICHTRPAMSRMAYAPPHPLTRACGLPLHAFH
jgi:hypothetical protein